MERGKSIYRRRKVDVDSERSKVNLEEDKADFDSLINRNGPPDSILLDYRLMSVDE